jgi:hypothetical protein
LISKYLLGRKEMPKELLNFVHPTCPSEWTKMYPHYSDVRLQVSSLTVSCHYVFPVELIFVEGSARNFTEALKQHVHSYWNVNL